MLQQETAARYKKTATGRAMSSWLNAIFTMSNELFYSDLDSVYTVEVTGSSPVARTILFSVPEPFELGDAFFARRRGRRRDRLLAFGCGVLSIHESLSSAT